MKNCYNCGTLLDDSASFCQNCGASFVQQPVQQNVQYQNYNQQPVQQETQYQGYNQQQVYQQGYSQQNYSVVQPEAAKPKKSKAPIIIIICAVVLIIVAVVIGIVVKSASGNDDYDDTGYYDSLNEENEENDQNDIIIPIAFGLLSEDGEAFFNASYGLNIIKPDENWIFDESAYVSSISGALYDDETGKCYFPSGLKKNYIYYMMYNTETKENLYVAYLHYDNEEIKSVTIDDIIDSMEESLVSSYESKNIDVIDSDSNYGEVDLNGYTYKRFLVNCVTEQGVELYQEYYISIINGNVVQICLTAGSEEGLAQMEGCIQY